MNDLAHHDADAASQTVTVCSDAGRLRARILRPARRSEAPPMLLLHGISRNPGTLARLFAAEAARTGRPLIVPHFDAAGWPVFQRPGRQARPDRALLDLLNRIAAEAPDLAGPVDVFGHSGGAQLAHRVAMLYPHRVGALHLVAAGWYCLPDATMPYPCGLAEGDTPFTARWARRMAAGLGAFLRRPVTVHVGTEDTDRDEALRQSPALDAGQGPTRRARAERYVAALNAAAAGAGLAPCARLNLLDGVDHDVVAALTRTDLAARVMAPGAPRT